MRTIKKNPVAKTATSPAHNPEKLQQARERFERRKAQREGDQL